MTPTALLVGLTVLAATVGNCFPDYARIAILVVPIWIAYAGFYIFVYPFYFSPFRHLPEPEKVSLPWAHAWFFLKEGNGPSFRTWVNTVPNGGIIRLRVLFNQERLLLTTPEACREILVTKSYEFTKPQQAGFLFRKLLGNGLLVAEGDPHKTQRRSILPAFAFRHIKDLYPMFWQKARQSTDEIAKASRGNVEGPVKPGQVVAQSVYEWANRVALDIIGQSGIGYDFNAVVDSESGIVGEYRKLFDNEPPQFFWLALGIDVPVHLVFYLPVPGFLQARRSAAAIRDFAHGIVQKKRKLLEKGEEREIDIMSVVMSSGNFTDGETVDQMMTFLAAGHETTASTMTWAMYMMCEHPDIQTRLREEIRANLPSIHDPSAEVSSQQIDKLPYLSAVCNEVMRINPTVPMTVRDATVDTTILGQHIPKGTRIAISPHAMNAKFDLWGESALEFDPERWMAVGKANTGGATNNFANMTFLHGPRSCIGKDFARSEFLCLMAAWIGRFEVSWAGGKPLPKDPIGWITSRPKHGMPVEFREVEGW